MILVNMKKDKPLENKKRKNETFILENAQVAEVVVGVECENHVSIVNKFLFGWFSSLIHFRSCYISNRFIDIQ